LQQILQPEASTHTEGKCEIFGKYTMEVKTLVSKLPSGTAEAIQRDLNIALKAIQPRPPPKPKSALKPELNMDEDGLDEDGLDEDGLDEDELGEDELDEYGLQRRRAIKLNQLRHHFNSCLTRAKHVTFPSRQYRRLFLRTLPCLLVCIEAVQTHAQESRMKQKRLLLPGKNDILIESANRLVHAVYGSVVPSPRQNSEIIF
jgi:hypothetical protein